MLSYRHSFHAGNFADVLKHIVLVEILEHLCKKDAGFDYIDTHSGAGLFNLKSAHAKKLEEHSTSIKKQEPTAGSYPFTQVPHRLLSTTCVVKIVDGYSSCIQKTLKLSVKIQSDSAKYEFRKKTD